MKRIIACLLAALMLTGALCACADASKTVSDTDRGDTLRVVCTIFPEYDWVTQILGAHAKDVEITMLLDTGVDLHSYQPTADDIIKVSDCNLFIYVGGESDAWVEDALKEAVNKDMAVISLLEVLGDTAKEEEAKEGMEAEAEEAGSEYDEHVWLSLKNASVFCKAISDGLCALDSANASDYRHNTDEYLAKLNDLDARYQQTVDSSPHKTLLFGDHFPFRYLVDDYQLDYYAAFAGCSAETEASFETIAFLAGKVDELGLSAVITIEGAQHRIAQTIIENTKDKDQQVLVMDSMQSVTLQDAQAGTTYLSVMTENLGVLKTALN